MEYTELTKEQQESMCKQRIVQYESEHFGHKLNLDGLQTLPDDDPGKAPAIENTTKSMQALEGSILAVRAELDELTKDPASTSPAE